MTMDS